MSVANFPGDPKDHTDDTPFEGMKSNTLSKAGYAYLLGDAALFAAGAMKGQWREASTGALWGVAGLFPAFYGDPKAEKELEMLSGRLGAYLKKQNIDIPKEPTTELLLKPHGAWDHMEEFFYTYPSQLLNAVYAIGSTTLISSGMHKKNRGDIMAGALVAAGALGGLLVAEKAPDPEHPPKTAFEKSVAWFQEKPLRISSLCYWANNIGLTLGALQDRRTDPTNKGYLFKYVTVASYVFGNLMLAMSSKGHCGADEKEDPTAMNALATSAAHVINAQPQEMREALIERIAGYLSTQPHAQMKAGEISQLLHTKLMEIRPLEKNWTQRLHTPSAPGIAPSM